jgi:hypothetical protein
MGTDHASTVRSRLISQVADLSASNCFTGLLRDHDQVPDKAVFVASSGGPEADHLFGPSSDVKSARVQIRVRGTRGDRDTTYALADSCYDAVNRWRPSGYISVTCDQSAPLPIGQDDNERYDYSINLTLRICE